MSESTTFTARAQDALRAVDEIILRPKSETETEQLCAALSARLKMATFHAAQRLPPPRKFITVKLAAQRSTLSAEWIYYHAPDLKSVYRMGRRLCVDWDTFVKEVML